VHVFIRTQPRSKGTSVLKRDLDRDFTHDLYSHFQNLLKSKVDAFLPSLVRSLSSLTRSLSSFALSFSSLIFLFASFSSFYLSSFYFYSIDIRSLTRFSRAWRSFNTSRICSFWNYSSAILSPYNLKYKLNDYFHFSYDLLIIVLTLR